MFFFGLLSLNKLIRVILDHALIDPNKMLPRSPVVVHFTLHDGPILFSGVEGLRANFVRFGENEVACDGVS